MTVKILEKKGPEGVSHLGYEGKRGISVDEFAWEFRSKERKNDP